MIDAASTKQMKYNAESAAVLEESVMNFKTIASCNGQKAVLQKYANGLQMARKYATEIAAFSGLFDGIFYCAMYVFFAAGF